MTPETKDEPGTQNDAAKEEQHSKERPEDHSYSASHRSPSLCWPKSAPGAVPVRLRPFQSRISVVSARNARFPEQRMVRSDAALSPDILGGLKCFAFTPGRCSKRRCYQRR